MAQKTSMSVAIEPVPDDVGATLLDVDPRTISAGDLILMFLADARQDGEFYYSFSKSTESGFELLKNWHTSEDGQYDVYYIDLFQSQPYPGMEDILGPNDVFLTRTSFFIPFDATHVELRFSSDSNTEFELLERYPLQSYSAWRENILPLTLTD